VTPLYVVAAIFPHDTVVRVETPTAHFALLHPEQVAELRSHSPGLFAGPNRLSLIDLDDPSLDTADRRRLLTEIAAALRETGQDVSPLIGSA